MYIKIQNGAISYGKQDVLEEINFEIKEKDKIAIIGKNGSGKTSLLQAIIGNVPLESGIGEDSFLYEKRKNITIGYLEQIHFEGITNTLYEELLKVFSHLISLKKEIESLETELKNSANISKYQELENQFKLLGGYEYQASIDKMIMKFGFSKEDKNKSIQEFSGGQKTKIALMKLLLSNPDILLLDEPTNHLDLNTIEWLEEYLQNYSKSVVIISHDRLFLDNIVSKVYEIEYGKLHLYKGNYSSYEKQKEENYQKLLKDYTYQQQEIKRLQSIADRFRYKPTKAKMALSKLKKIEQMTIIEEPKQKDSKQFKINFPIKRESSEIVLNVKNLEIGYDTPIKTVTFQLHKQERLAILGANGVGKTTLLKTLYHLLKPLKGMVEYGSHLDMLYYDQSLTFLDESNTILEEFKCLFPELSSEDIRKKLGSFLFTEEDVFKQIKVLSGGEKARLHLARILLQGPNLILMDEPTNHLDLIGKQTLEKFLSEYLGTLIFVSHDRYFISKLANSFLILDEEPPVFYRGMYTDYKKNSQAIKTIKKEDKKKEKIVSNYKERQKLQKQVEKEINKIEERLKEIDVLMTQEDNYTNYQQMNALLEEKQKNQELLEQKMQLWEKLMLVE